MINPPKPLSPEEVKKAAERVKEVLNKIWREYPEIMTREKGTTFQEKVLAYHQLKDIESRKLHDKIMIILTCINIFLVGLIGYLTLFK